jgi:hypothetical protein
MPDGLLRLIVGGAIVLHGLGHGGAIGALWWVASRPRTDAGGWQAARSWLFPGLAGPTATALAVGFWFGSEIGFVVAALGFWGIVVPADWWRPAAVGSGIESLVGNGLFVGTWPAFNTVAAVMMNVAVLVAIFWLRWPAEAASAR